MIPGVESHVKRSQLNDRSSSLPSLITQWTCVRCLLENSCSSALTCVACDVNSSVFETDKRQIGARKSKKQNLRKTSRLKVASEFLASILNGPNATSMSTSDARIISKGIYSVEALRIRFLLVFYVS